MGLSCLAAVFFTGCGGPAYEMEYSAAAQISSFNVLPVSSTKKAGAFAEDLCVVTEDIVDDEALDMSQAEAAGLFDLNNRQALYAKNVHERLYPASLTKIMTALVSLENGSLDQVLTATQLLGLKSGDTMTLDQALHFLLMYSANDVAMLIAENIGGSVEEFVDMMNREALRLGATNTHFVNPHGLSDDEHYTTAYDMYLIFNEAVKYDTFSEIIHMTSYQTTYYDRNGAEKPASINTTNQFLSGKYDSPESVTVIGGKTGTTNAARSCLVLLARDAAGAPYISVILKAETGDILYAKMTDLLGQINK